MELIIIVSPFILWIYRFQDSVCSSVFSSFNYTWWISWNITWRCMITRWVSSTIFLFFLKWMSLIVFFDALNISCAYAHYRPLHLMILFLSHTFEVFFVISIYKKLYALGLTNGLDFIFWVFLHLLGMGSPKNKTKNYGMGHGYNM